MSEENKDLGDEANEAMENAKKKAENLGDNAEDTFDKGKEEAKDFGDKAEEAAKDFKEDVKNAFNPNNPDSGKTVAIITHITFIGTIVALVMNSSNKTVLGSYYIRQTIGIWLLFFLLSFIPIVGCFTWILALVLIVMSVINAANEKMVPTPLVGEYFQDWFKSL